MMSKVKFNSKISDLESKLILSVDDLKASTLLDYNIDPVKIIPYILEAQELKLEPAIGTALYRELQANDRTFEYDYLVNNYISKTLIHWALESFLEVAPYSVANGGVYKHLPTDAETVSSSEVGLMLQRERYKSKQYADRMLSFLNTYKYHFPEYTDCQSEGIKAARTFNLSGGLVLEQTDPAPKSTSGLQTCGCGDTCTNYICTSCGYDPDLFTVDFWEGESNDDQTTIDLDTLTKYNRIPNEVEAQPTANYYWVVSDWNIEILQGNIAIPLDDISNAIPEEAVYVKTFANNKYYIRIKIQDTYESIVRFNVKIKT